MKIISLSVIILFPIFIVRGVQSVCCPAICIDYQIKDGYQCTDIHGGGGYWVCSIGVCGDGLSHDGHYYCGQGDCNVFGCNCDNGCIPGNRYDAITNFWNINKNKLEDIYAVSLCAERRNISVVQI